MEAIAAVAAAVDAYRVDLGIVTSELSYDTTSCYIPQEHLLVSPNRGHLAVVATHGYITHFIAMAGVGFDVKAFEGIP